MGRTIYNIPEVCGFFNAAFVGELEKIFQKGLVKKLKEKSIEEYTEIKKSKIEKMLKDKIESIDIEESLKELFEQQKCLFGFYNEVFIIGERPSIYDLYGLGAVSLRYMSEVNPEILELEESKIYKPALRVVSTEELKTEHYQYTTVLIGSPYTNELVRALTTEGENPLKLDFELNLPFKFKIDDSVKLVDILDSEDLSIIDEFNKYLKEYQKKHRKFIKEHPEYHEELPEKEVSESICELVAQKEKRWSYQPMFIPVKDDGADKGFWNTDYFMILKLPSLRKGYEESRRGQSTYILAGCHGLGTGAACGALYNGETLKELSKIHEYFQAWGKFSKGSNIEIMGVEKLQIR